MFEAFDNPFFVRAILAGLLASIACGVVGTYVVVRKISSISGGLSHAAFGGVGLGYWLGFEPMLGGTLFALLAGTGVGFAYRRLQSSLDTLIAMVWSVGMALGLLFISLKEGYAPELQSYIFGSILFVPTYYLVIVAVLDALILAVVLALFRELRAVVFDEEFARLRGIPVEPIFLLLLALISLAVVILIKVAGVILVIALLTIPAATARQWSDSLPRMMVISTLMAALCTTAGLFIAYGFDEALGLNVQTGPAIILFTVLLFGASSALRSLRGRT